MAGSVRDKSRDESWEKLIKRKKQRESNGGKEQRIMWELVCEGHWGSHSGTQQASNRQANKTGTAGSSAAMGKKLWIMMGIIHKSCCQKESLPNDSPVDAFWCGIFSVIRQFWNVLRDWTTVWVMELTLKPKPSKNGVMIVLLLLFCQCVCVGVKNNAEHSYFIFYKLNGSDAICQVVLH